MDFVLDNSIVMRWLFDDGGTKDRQYSETILNSIVAGTYTPIAPGIWPLEIANVISRAEAMGQIEEMRSAHFLEIIREMGVTTEPVSQSVCFGGVLHLARAYKLSSYDSAYLELAMRQGIPLATLDKDLIGAMKKVGVPRLLV
ncbi:type II toxin-antitoxin system VapC family toxin [Polynucleobacter antarcticus]|uniref:VapC toxin family PIN domain ribonuclease n=1 Tax=Polynucleobacter antarcticus TaxID=1743162 RepID=A0A6M9PQG5_9BURK|nr:type II toxin-antitoxin system VapC family toxin [Polynucleobacter antarcticus]QKM61708.1 VapC toxin family PIN domain ribonuclease [Polynucleobacter antarcticus]